MTLAATPRGPEQAELGSQLNRQLRMIHMQGGMIGGVLGRMSLWDPLTEVGHTPLHVDIYKTHLRTVEVLGLRHESLFHGGQPFYVAPDAFNGDTSLKRSDAADGSWMLRGSAYSPEYGASWQDTVDPSVMEKEMKPVMIEGNVVTIPTVSRVTHAVLAQMRHKKPGEKRGLELILDSMDKEDWREYRGSGYEPFRRHLGDLTKKRPGVILRHCVKTVKQHRQVSYS